MKKNEIIRRWVLSILFGLIGFYVSVKLSISFVVHDVVISIDWGAIFPLLIAFAYGSTFAAITGFIGLSALYPFIIWANNGFGCVLASFNNLLFYVWHGYVSSKQKESSFDFRNHLIAQIPYTFYYGISLFILYPVLFSMNPPWWNNNTNTSIERVVLLSIIYKSTFIMMMNVIIAGSLIKITSIRKFLHLPYKEESHLNGRILLISVAISIVFWLIFIILTNSLRYNSSFIVVDTKEIHQETSLLVFIICGFFSGTIISHYAERQLRYSKELAEKNADIQKMADELEIKVEERTHELKLLNDKLSMEIIERESFAMKLKELNIQMEATLNALPDMMFDIDDNGVIYDYRVTNDDTLYASPNEFMGKKVCDILPEEVCRVISNSISYAQQHGSSSGSIYKLEYPEGIHWFELSIAKKKRIEGTKDRFVSLVRDITDRKKVEEELRLRSEELEAFNKIMIDREMRIVGLKEEVNALSKLLGVELPYPHEWKDTGNNE